MTVAVFPTCPGCGVAADSIKGAPQFTCSCVPGLDYPEEASAELDQADEPETLDVGSIDQAWVEDQIEKRLSLQAELDRLGEQYLARVARKKAEIKEHEDRTLFLVRAWFDAQPKKGKTLALATGTLKTKLNRGGPKIVNEAETLAWAEANAPKFVRTLTTKKLDTAAVREFAKTEREESGELIPGVEFTEDWESFLIDGPKSTGEEV